MQFKIEEWTKLSSLIDEQIAKLKKIGTNETGYTISADRLKRLKKRLQNASEGATVSFTERDKVDLCWHIDELDNLSDFFLQHYLTDLFLVYTYIPVITLKDSKKVARFLYSKWLSD